jgi:hypothetical protein
MWKRVYNDVARSQHRYVKQKSFDLLSGIEQSGTEPATSPLIRNSGSNYDESQNSWANSECENEEGELNTLQWGDSAVGC